MITSQLNLLWDTDNRFKCKSKTNGIVCNIILINKIMKYISIFFLTGGHKYNM